MRLPRFRVRTLMAAVCVVASLLWGATMGSRSYDYARRATAYDTQERGWRGIAVRVATRDPYMAQFGLRCADYFAELAEKYRGAAWRPWAPVAPDPAAPGNPSR